MGSSGWLFVAVKGEKNGGHAYIDSAVEAGAVAILGNDSTRKGEGFGSGARHGWLALYLFGGLALVPVQDDDHSIEGTLPGSGRS